MPFYRSFKRQRSSERGSARTPALIAPAARNALVGMVVAGFAMSVIAPSALAQQATVMEADVRSYTIDPGPLGQVLSRFANAAGIVLSFDANVTAGLRSPGLRGDYRTEDALALLLRGHALSVARTTDGSYLLQRVLAQGDAIVLDAVRVEGDVILTDEDRPFATAGSATHLSQERIERFRGTSVGDIFQGVPGVLIGENRNSGGVDVNIRGMQGQGRVPVLVDGARQETTVYRGYAGVASRTYIDPDLIGGIDIQKGPGMSAQGTGAIGGLVSMRTIGANDIIRDDKNWGVRVRGSAIGNNSGSAVPANTPAGYAVGGEMFNGVYRINCQYDCSRDNPLPDPLATSEGMDRPGLLNFDGWAGSIAAAWRLQHVDLVAAYAQREQGNYYAGKNGPSATIDLSDQVARGFWTDVYPKLGGASRFRAGERIVNTEYASNSLLLKSTFWLPQEQSLELGVVRYESEYGEIMPSMLLRFGQALQAPSSTVDARTFTARYTWAPEDRDWIDLRANVWRTDTRSRNVNYPDDMVEMSPQLENMMGTERYERWGADISNTMRFKVLGELQWRYGAAWQLEDVRPADRRHDAGEESVRDGERSEISVFTALQWKPLPSLTLDAGLRYSDFSADDRSPPFIPPGNSSQCIDLDGDGACDQISVHHTEGSGGTPLASVTWEPLTGLQFYALYAEAMRMPSLFESTRGFSATQAFDVAVKPEHAYNREIGINLLRDGFLFDQDKLRVKAAYFQNTVRDYLTRTSPNLWEESFYTAQIFTLRNIEKVTFHGYELSIEHDMGVAFWSVAGTRYNHVETCHYGSYRRYDCTDYGIANSYINNMIPPNWHASATVGTRLFNWRLTLGARATFMGKRNSQPPYQDDTQRGFNQVVPWHDYTLVDLFASYRLASRLSMDFNVDNLTDRYYLDALGLGLLPSPGRAARLSVTMQF